LVFAQYPVVKTLKEAKMGVAFWLLIIDYLIHA